MKSSVCSMNEIAENEISLIEIDKSNTGIIIHVKIVQLRAGLSGGVDSKKMPSIIRQMRLKENIRRRMGSTRKLSLSLI